MGYPFGQDFKYTFYPIVDEKEALDIPDPQTPTIYIFSDSDGTPSRSVAIAGTGADQTISSWTKRGAGFEFTISALTDPDVNSTQDKRTYWLAINFLLKAGGQVQTIIRALEMERVAGHHKSIGVTAVDIGEMWPGVTSYLSEAQITALIALSTEELRALLKNRSFEWAQVYRPDRFRLAVIFKTLMHVMLNQRRDVGDNFDRNYEEYKVIFNSTIGSIKVEYDTDNNGQPQKEPLKTGGFAYVSR